MTHETPPTRRLIILGSTGSIGTSALEVVEHLRDRGLLRFEVVGLAAGANVARVAEQAARFGVAHVAIADGTGTGELSGIPHLHVGPDAAVELIDAVAEPGDLVLGAMVGAAGVPATLAAIDRGCDIALANKETLVAAGVLVMPRVRKQGVHLLPVDSEHSAIFQSLAAGRSVEEVVTANSLKSPDKIRIGQQLVIPAHNRLGSTSPPSRHVVRRGENLTLIASRYGVSVEALKRSNGLGSSLIYPGQALAIP